MENTMSQLYQKPTRENMYINNLNLIQLESLLPCSRPDMEKIIRDRIDELRNVE